MTARKRYSDLDFNARKGTNLGAPGTDNDAARKIDVDNAYNNARSRANHTGTQLAATISDFDTQVRTNRLDQLAAPAGSVSFANQKIINLLDPTTNQDAATKNYVDVSLAGLQSGQTPKGSVRAVVKTNVNISSPGSTLDGLNAVAGDIFLLAGQTTGSQNGPYVWNGASSPMTRATNWDTQTEAVLGSYWVVREGTEQDKFALLTNDSFTLGTSTATFNYIGIAPAATAPVEQDLGNSSATTFTITHNFGTRAVNVVIYRNSSPWDDIDVYVRRPDLNTVVIEPDTVFATNEFHAVVSKL